MKLKSALLSAIISAAALSGCAGTDTSPDQVRDPVYQNFMTYCGTSQQGVSTLTYQKVNDSPLITLTAEWTPQPSISEGQRVLTLYTAREYGISGHITVKGWMKLPGGTIKEPESMPQWSPDPLTVVMMERAGHYLNFEGYLDANGQTHVLDLVLDPDTRSLTYPVAYLFHSSRSQLEGAPTRIFASWNVEPVWSLPHILGLKVKVMDPQGREREFLFEKSDQLTPNQ